MKDDQDMSGQGGEREDYVESTPPIEEEGGASGGDGDSTELPSTTCSPESQCIIDGIIARAMEARRRAIIRRTGVEPFRIPMNINLKLESRWKVTLGGAQGGDSTPLTPHRSSVTCQPRILFGQHRGRRQPGGEGEEEEVENEEKEEEVEDKEKVKEEVEDEEKGKEEVEDEEKGKEEVEDEEKGKEEVEDEEKGKEEVEDEEKEEEDKEKEEEVEDKEKEEEEVEQYGTPSNPPDEEDDGWETAPEEP